ncbi:hypothetical protein PG993_000009 [Apiospora rasikravindrae]|uniref:Uncharacterized protein n=1 Tax=Apiospora rasikravindrae TaxID=990691 RepID=A0ABR1U7D2_9PEZI
MSGYLLLLSGEDAMETTWKKVNESERPVVQELSGPSPAKTGHYMKRQYQRQCLERPQTTQLKQIRSVAVVLSGSTVK